MTAMQDVCNALKKGSFVLVYDADGREEETDFVVPSAFVRQEHILEMRREGGGLICSTVTAAHADKIGLPYLSDVLSDSRESYPVLGELLGAIPYDSKSAFSITINHRNAYTGITDRDRSMCARALGEFIDGIEEENDSPVRFAETFRTPGHLHLLRASPQLLDDRQGHTDLATFLCIMAGVPPSATICEMMGEEGGALPPDDAAEYAKKNGHIFIRGKDILEEWKNWSR